MRSYKWALTQYDCYLFKKKRLGQQQTQREDHVKTQEDDGHLQDREEGLRRDQPYQHLDS